MKPKAFATVTVAEYRELVRAEMSEDDLLAEVARLLTLGHWRWHHMRRSDLGQPMGDPGFPDIIAVRNGVLLAIELKTAKGRMEVGQVEWLRDLASVVNVHDAVWRPATVDEIRELLR